MTMFQKYNRDPELPRERRFPNLSGLLKLVGIGVAILILFTIVIRVTRIEAGHVGVEINLAGNQRGASEIPIRTGWVFIVR